MTFAGMILGSSIACNALGSGQWVGCNEFLTRAYVNQSNQSNESHPFLFQYMSFDPFFQFSSSLFDEWDRGMVTSSSLVDQQMALAFYRGLCNYGMHELPSGVCIPQMTYPNALSIDAMLGQLVLDPTSSLSVRACGNWLAGAEQSSPPGTMYSFGAIHYTSRSMWALVSARASSAGGTIRTRRASKLLSDCRQTVENGDAALGLTMRLAHQALLGDILEYTTLESVLKRVGVLSSHACPSFVSLGLHTTHSGFHASISNGDLPSIERIERALGGLHAGSNATSDILDEYSSLLSSSCAASTWVTHAAFELVFSGIVGEPVTLQSTPASQRNSLAHLATLMCVIGDAPLSSSQGSTPLRHQARASAILSGIAAECAALVVDRIRGPDKAEVSTSGGHVMPLGRTSRWKDQPIPAVQPFEPPSRDEWNAATQRTWRRAVPSVEDLADLQDSCFEAIVYGSIDEVERVLFEAIVPTTLYDRLGQFVESVRTAMSNVITNTVFNQLFVNPGDVIHAIQTCHFRIPGAPSMTWAGRTYELPLASESQTHGIAHALLLEQQAHTRDSVRIALGMNELHCNLPPLFDASEPNAYYLYAANCIVVTPGLLRMPFADVSYDDESLFSRIGFIIAHEIAHASLVSGRYETIYYNLFDHYTPISTYEEALADVLAMTTLVSLHPEHCNRTMLHVAQLFCATPQGPISSTHPTGNLRVDALQQTLREKLHIECGG